MADKFSVEDLLSEYNDKLDRFDANKFAEQKRSVAEAEAHLHQHPIDGARLARRVDILKLVQVIHAAKVRSLIQNS